ncbi:hypothetical protein KIW84_050443 [Lathyrus oleraceus]|uniref:WW domain-containing protein n=1 Tax=Pisum sativum TaxID=3888 RepID=A0A9D5A9D2_PEA|nr:hypothetical protein KIW84_050442 [Pisum sativum]KAI5402847.1 hypothetical protein KIW84_050443 [Pisum sativum]
MHLASRTRGLPRPPFHQYPAAFPGPFPFPARGVTLPTVPVPDSQPPGVTPVGPVGISTFSGSGHHFRGTPGLQAETEAGIMYYYNVVTGESTYDKPAGFKGEAHQVSVQPTPVSMVDLPGTDWQLVSTSDGRKYYYNNATRQATIGSMNALHGNLLCNSSCSVNAAAHSTILLAMDNPAIHSKSGQHCGIKSRS